MRAPGTSESSPLRVAAVTPGEGHGRIGITLCPGKTDPAGMTGPWARDLDADLDAIERWGATAVVGLITDAELDLLSVRDLPRAVRDRHMEWWHVPIPDGQPPGPEFEDAWAVAGEAVRDRLSLGFDVLVHCRGGLGRAGTVAARLLVELGASPDEAIRRVREARSPCAIETTSQKAHVARCSARAPSAPPRTAAANRDRALGAFLGLAVGDAVGTTLEFEPRDAKPRLEDMTGGGPFRLPPGAWTDDTAMALALADNLADDADTVAAVTGQFAGALYGLSAIPDRWLERLAWKDRLIEARTLPTKPARVPGSTATSGATRTPKARADSNAPAPNGGGCAHHLHDSAKSAPEPGIQLSSSGSNSRFPCASSGGTGRACTGITSSPSGSASVEMSSSSEWIVVWLWVLAMAMI